MDGATIDRIVGILFLAHATNIHPRWQRARLASPFVALRATLPAVSLVLVGGLARQVLADQVPPVGTSPHSWARLASAGR